MATEPVVAAGSPRPRRRSRYAFDARRYEAEITAILQELSTRPELDDGFLDRTLRRHPKDGRGFFSKSELVRGLRHLAAGGRWPAPEAAELEARLRTKPVRTLSGVAPVTVLTKPFPCPGRCLFCPADVRMPKSYLSSEPGAQRAAQHDFDPHAQTWARLLAIHNTGHPWDKVELLVLGGTWSSYPEAYQRWFLTRCFEALNRFDPGAPSPAPELPSLALDRLPARVDGRRSPGRGESAYNRRVAAHLRRIQGGGLRHTAEAATWEELSAAQRANETAAARCVGLVVETRPDRVGEREVERLRRLGVTRVQLGVQSLSDEVLALNRRGHGVAESRRAATLLRRAGFKILVHWMPNLYGSTPRADVEDFHRLFADPALRPDELKIYPCSLVESAELMRVWEQGRWRPYRREELLEVLTRVMAATPAWCRLTRVIRDIPGGDIVSGNRTTNLRQVAEEMLARRGVELAEIRSREVRGHAVAGAASRLEALEYAAGGGREVFLQALTAGGRLAGFLRLFLPAEASFLPEIAEAALIREVHVYGTLVGFAAAAPATAIQHRGLGRRLVERAEVLAAAAGYRDLAVISAVGTKAYYRRLGFADGGLYQHRPL